MKRIGSAIFAVFIAGYFSVWNQFAYSGNSNDLWLEITNVNSIRIAGLLHNSSPFIPYAIFSKQALQEAAWGPAATVYGDQTTNRSALSVTRLERKTLFIRAQANVAPGTLGAGFLYNVALKRDGTVSAWGVGDSGELGNDGSWGSPVPVSVTGLSNIVSIAANGSFALALNSSGIVWSWGSDWNGQLGRGDELFEDGNVAAPVPGLSNIVAIAGGYDHAAALKSDGTVWTWGSNGSGQLGDGTTMRRDYAASVPALTNIIIIASGTDHNFALGADGTVWAWGYNGNGALGIGNTENQLQPVAVAGLTNVVALAGGFDFSLALLSNGTVMAWGDGGDGEMGDGGYDNSLTPVVVPTLSNIVAIACGGNHGLALNASGTLFVWGCGYDGELGNGEEGDVPTPFAINSISSIVAIAGGEYSSMISTSDGMVHVWGVYGYSSAGSDWRVRHLPFEYDLYDTLDSDNDGLPDWFETGVGTAANNADSDDDGFSDYWELYSDNDPLDPDDAPQIQLGSWKFDTTDWLGEAGQVPLKQLNLQSLPDWDGSALRIDTNTPALLSYQEIETNVSVASSILSDDTVPQADYAWNINLRKGTVRFWFKPDWSSVGAGGTGPGSNAALIAVGSHSPDCSNDFWGLECDSNGDQLLFSSEGAGQRHIYAIAPVSFSSNAWCQIVLTYDTNSSAICTNGQVAALGSGVAQYPGRAVRQALGFNIGSDNGGDEQMLGLIDNLETFNYPMSESTVASEYSQAISAETAAIQFPDSALVSTNGMQINVQGVPLATVCVSLLFNGTNYNYISSQPFCANPGILVPVTLDLGDGAYVVSVGIWNGTGYDWSYRRMVLDTTPPFIVPAGQTVTTNFPLLQLRGYATEALSSISFDLSNCQATNLDQCGYVTDSDGNTYAGAISTNQFQCFDIKLAPGANIITLRCADLAGNVRTNFYSYTLDTASMTAPALAVDWPSDSSVLSGDVITVQGHISDPTAVVTAQVTLGGSTNNIPGVVERDGRFWIDDVPLAADGNLIRVTATDMASNSATATVTVQRSPVNIRVDPIAGDALEDNTTTVSGRIDSGGYAITVNGVSATIWTNADGNIAWQALNVPVPAGGIASFKVHATQSSGDPETCVSFDKPTFIRMKSYNEDVNSQGLEHHLDACDTPYSKFYSQLSLQRSQRWALGAGGTGVQDYYSYDCPIFGQISQIGPVHTNWILTAADPPPAVPWEHADSGDGVSHVLDRCGAYYNYRRTAQTRVEVVAGGRAIPGQSTTVALKASATEAITGVGNFPLPPHKVRITDRPCADSGDGSNGIVTVVIPAGATNLDITPRASSRTDTYSFEVSNITWAIAVDANRDGQFDFGNCDATSAGCPYRFWVNDSVEAGDIVFDADDQIPGVPLTSAPEVPQPNYYYDWVRGHSDAVNFFPVILRLGNALQLLPPSEGYDYRLVQTDAAFKFVYTTLAPTNAFDYLTNPQSFGYGAGSGEWFTNADTIAVTSPPGVVLNTNWLGRIQTNGGTGVILLEGSAATTSPLWLEVWRNGRLLAGTPLYIDFSPVEQMFRHKNLMAAAGGTGGQPDRLNQSDVPNEPATVDRNLVFLHGYNVNADQARGVLSEMFKRFYWSGSKARFYGVTWNGADSQVSGYVTPNYHTNVMHAVSTAPALATFLGGLSGSTSVAAHSLGNMVVLSALNDYNARLDKYFMIDAAVAIEALDASAEANADMAHPDWAGYDQRLWASEWHNLFPTNDVRNTLTWRGRFSNLRNADVYNFYSSGEEVLRAESGKPPTGLISALYDQGLAFLEGEGGAYVWVWQEKAKGLMEGNLLIGSSYGGWGFNIFDGYLPAYPIWYVGLPGGRRVKSPAEMDSITADLLDGCQFNPLFKSGWGGYLANDPGQVYVTTDTQYFTGPNWILGLYQAESGSAIASDRTKNTQLLADAFPALTLPVGANLVSELGFSHNWDMQARFENGWPADRPPRQVGIPAAGEWHHSDFDCVAYPFVYQLFHETVTLGNLK